MPIDPVTTADKSPPPPQFAPVGQAPTISQSVQVDWGSWAAQLLRHITPIVEAGVNTAVSDFAPTLRLFVGPKLVNQTLEQALLVLENVLDKRSITIDGSKVLLATVARMVVVNEAAFATFMGDYLEPMIIAEMKKLSLWPADA